MDDEELAADDAADDGLLTGSSDYGDDYTASSSGLTTGFGPGADAALATLVKSNEQARAALVRAREKASARKYNNALALLAVSAAFGKPTRTGAFAESLGNAADALTGPLREKQQFEQTRDKELLDIDTNLAGLDRNTATAQLQLAQLSAKLASDRARAPNDRVVLENGDVVYKSRADARQPGMRAWTPPPAVPPTGFTVVQQPQADGTTRPKLLNTKTGELTDAGDAYVPTKLSSTGRQQALGKMQTLKVLKAQLADIRKTWEPLKNSMSAGFMQGWMPTEVGRSFDKAVAAARGTIRQITRVPGEGSMSDWEGKIDQAKLPDRNDWESVNEQAMDQLDTLVKAYEDSTLDMLGAKPEDDKKTEGNAQEGKTRKYDKSGKRIE